MTQPKAGRPLPAAAILAGGLATRLRPAIQEIPKALVEIAGRPFILHLIDLLRANGVERLVLCVGYLGEQVVDLVGDGSRFGVHVEYSFDGPTLLGTAGALKRAGTLLGEEFFVLNGDTYLDCDYRGARSVYEESGKAALMVIYRNDGRGEPSNVVFSKGEILRYDKLRRTADMKHIDCGVGILRQDVLSSVPEGEPCDLTRVFQSLIQQGQLAGFEVGHRYYEIGSMKGIAETNVFFGVQGAPKDEGVRAPMHNEE